MTFGQAKSECGPDEWQPPRALSCVRTPRDGPALLAQRTKANDFAPGQDNGVEYISAKRVCYIGDPGAGIAACFLSPLSRS